MGEEIKRSTNVRIHKSFQCVVKGHEQYNFIVERARLIELSETLYRLIEIEQNPDSYDRLIGFENMAIVSVAHDDLDWSLVNKIKEARSCLDYSSAFKRTDVVEAFRDIRPELNIEVFRDCNKKIVEMRGPYAIRVLPKMDKFFDNLASAKWVSASGVADIRFGYEVLDAMTLLWTVLYTRPFTSHNIEMAILMAQARFPIITIPIASAIIAERQHLMAKFDQSLNKSNKNITSFMNYMFDIIEVALDMYERYYTGVSELDKQHIDALLKDKSSWVSYEELSTDYDLNGYILDELGRAQEGGLVDLSEDSVGINEQQ